MSQALHSGFDRIAPDPAGTFVRVAPLLLDLPALVAAFDAALALEDARGHRCFVLDGDERLPLTQSPDRIVGEAASDTTFRIAAPDGETLLLIIDCAESPDRSRRARLHLLATVYAAHVVPLIEVEETDGPTQDDALTARERECLRLLLTGLSHLDIGDALDLSAPAVGIHLRRAAARLGAGSPLDACAIALARGLLT
ncbi:helix-turn-helix transcriptional regulator [Sphingobium sufflavum]|uniref:helix-turn-helix transcriptional regulator n=1 Tax=Sphingobium sufflavum TaxID=1129547 RepID=UPI001F476BE1|nr:LuxR C-terminal-related transcriptional regulator [Sphingobium sufflavum]MCE7797100.1 helix-turn-helix transcriptional regulator [Sphingobium sufflavum]